MKLTRAVAGDPKYVRPLEAEHLEMLVVELRGLQFPSHSGVTCCEDCCVTTSALPQLLAALNEQHAIIGKLTKILARIPRDEFSNPELDLLTRAMRMTARE
jgi:hypothetical protein